MTASRWLLIGGAASGALIVVLGAYGGHALRGTEHQSLFQTAVQYHMFHTLGVLTVGLAAASQRSLALFVLAGMLMLAGVVLFCGSLYVAALTGYRGLGMLTPIGGTAFILGWVFFVVALARSR